MDYSNIPTGLKITSQIPLNSKEWVKDEATLAYLGVDDNLAFTYHDQLEVLCLAEKTLYIWREVQPGEENTGLVPLDFTYPNDLPETFQTNYSGKKYNFFLKEYVTIDNIYNLINIENVGEGKEIYKNRVNNIFNLKTLSSKSNKIKITPYLNEIDFDINITSLDESILVSNGENGEINLQINPDWLISWLQNNTPIICAITSVCKSDTTYSNFGYSKTGTACGLPPSIYLYRNTPGTNFVEATLLAYDSNFTNLADPGYYSEYDSTVGAICSRYWNGTEFLGGVDGAEVCT